MGVHAAIAYFVGGKSGGAWGVGVSAWLKWQLKGYQAAANMFTGATCGLCSDPKWTIE
jgi:hypothetical protein